MSVFCVECGLKIEDSFKFCPSCGAKVVSQPKNEKESQKESSEECMGYKINENGEEVFWIKVVIGKGESAKTRILEYAKGNGAKLCKNGIEAMETLKNEGYSFKGTEMAETLGAKFDLADDNCVVLTPDVIVKLYKVNKFFDVQGHVLNWRELPEDLNCEFSELGQIDLISILQCVAKNKLDTVLPVINLNDVGYSDNPAAVHMNAAELREGESLLLRSDYDGALAWYLKEIKETEDSSGYSYNIIGQLYLKRARESGIAYNQDYDEARKWLEKSMRCGNLLGTLNLGIVYEKGLGIKKSPGDAVNCYLKAYKTGNKKANNSLERFLSDDLIELYENGYIKESDYNFEVLADKLEKDAEERTPSMLNIGYMYQVGLGREVSLTKAAHYYMNLLIKSSNSSSSDGDMRCLRALDFLDSIRKSDNGDTINQDNEKRLLNNLASIEKSIRDYDEEIKCLKEAQFGEKEPVLGYRALWSEDPQYRNGVKQDNEIDKGIRDVYRAGVERWKKDRDLRLAELEKKSNEAKAVRDRMKPELEEAIPSRYLSLDRLGFISDYVLNTDRTIEEAVWISSRVFSFNYRIESGNRGNFVGDSQYVQYQGETFDAIKPIAEVVSELLEKEKRNKQLKDDDEKSKKGIFGKKRPLKPVLKFVTDIDGKTEEYGDRVCDTVDQYNRRTAQFIQDLKNYYLDKLQWLAEQPRKRVEFNRKMSNLDSEMSQVYNRLDIPRKYRSIKALEFISKQISSNHYSVQTAIEEYDKYQLAEKKRKEEEKRRIEQEEEERRLEESRRKMAQWDREYEEQEAAYARRQEERYYERNSGGSGGGSFLRDVASAAIGGSIANRGVKKELRKQREEANEREKARRAEEDRKKREAAHRSQVEWENVRKANIERRRKGLPELPYPDRFYW